ncbi:MAG: hypothetical protein EON95_10210 [Caulobacteraceae bacterium]|nr:MAG: hypothetical protein EON95_10210 [Caulobacteraceae bacterium]
MTTTFSKRDNAFERGEHVWRVEDDCLIWTRPGGDSLTLLWKDVGAVRAAFAPTRWKRWRHIFELTTRKGATLLIDNAHFKTVGDFEDRSASFVPFVLACIDRVVALAPDGLILVKLALIAVLAPVAVLWAVRAWPRAVALSPAALLAGLPKLPGNLS